MLRKTKSESNKLILFHGNNSDFKAFQTKNLNPDRSLRPQDKEDNLCSPNNLGSKKRM